jgi:hypothetical protein
MNSHQHALSRWKKTVEEAKTVIRGENLNSTSESLCDALEKQTEAMDVAYDKLAPFMDAESRTKMGPLREKTALETEEVLSGLMKLNLIGDSSDFLHEIESIISEGSKDEDLETIKDVDDDPFPLDELEPINDQHKETAVKFCPHCGTQATIESKFCAECGKSHPRKKAPEQFSMQLEPLIDRLEMPRAVIPMFDGNPLQYSL